MESQHLLKYCIRRLEQGPPIPVCACAAVGGRGTAAGAAAGRARWRASGADRSDDHSDVAAAVGTPRRTGSAPRRPSHLQGGKREQ